MTRIAHVSTGDLAAQNIAALIAGRPDERQIIVDDGLAYGPLRDLHTAAGRAARIAKGVQVANQEEGRGGRHFAWEGIASQASTRQRPSAFDG